MRLRDFRKRDGVQRGTAGRDLIATVAFEDPGMLETHLALVGAKSPTTSMLWLTIPPTVPGPSGMTAVLTVSG